MKRSTGNRPSDWRTTVWLFGLASFAESMAFGHFSAFTPLYLTELGVHGSAIATWTGILGSLGFVLGLPLLPFWGAWAERFGRKPVIIRSSVVEAVIFAVAALARSPYQLAVARLLSGFVMGNTGVMMSVQSEITPDSRLGFAIAVIGSGPSIATAIGPLFGGIFLVHFGIRSLFFFDSAATATAALLMALLLHERPRTRSPAGVIVLAGQALRDILALPAVRRLFLLFFFVSFGTIAANPFLPLWITAAYRHGGPLGTIPLPEAIGVVFTVAGVAMALATPLWGWAIDRVGRLPCLRLAASGTALGLGATGLLPSLLAIVAARTLQGLSQGGITPALTAILARVAPEERRSAILNLSILPQQIGWFFGPATATGIVHLLGLQGMFLAFGGLSAVGALMSFSYRPSVASAVPLVPTNDDA